MNKIRKGDNVQVLAGKEAGKTGQVERVLTKKDKVIVAGVNVYKRHVKKQGQTEGGIIDIIKPLNISNVGLVCPNCKKTTRVGFELGKEGKSRICKKCGKVV